MTKVVVTGMVTEIIFENEKTYTFIVKDDENKELGCSMNLYHHNKNEIELGQEYEITCEILSHRSQTKSGKTYMNPCLSVRNIKPLI